MNEADRPSAVLRAEHQVILRVIAVLQRLVDRSVAGAGFDHAALSRCVEFFRLFADACHHAKEEDLLFPTLEARGIPRDGGPIGVMLHEHRVAREYTRAMADALHLHHTDPVAGARCFHDAALGYAELLRNHIAKEDRILFTMGDRVMSPQDQENLCGRFCEVGCRSFEGRTRAQLVALAESLEQAAP